VSIIPKLVALGLAAALSSPVPKARLESMMPAARGLAKANNIKMRLIKFTNRVDIENIVP
jgi:hypothetical protein